MVGIEFRVDFIRQQLHGDGKVKQGVIPDHGIHMIDLLNFCLQGSYILVRHILHDNEGKKAPFPKSSISSFCPMVVSISSGR